ncbi:MAG: carbonic anhydrase family protein [Candidatus Kapaibacterium sp.]
MKKVSVQIALFTLLMFTVACAEKEENSHSAESSGTENSHSPSGASTPSADILTADERNGMTPDQVIALLEEGNKRFTAGDLTDRDYVAQVKGTAAGQYPMAVVLSCLDSRVPPELIFDRGIGDLFVGRVAGNFENRDMVGSMEFGTKVAGAKVIAVIGHTECGAVKGACDGVELGNLTGTLQNLDAAIARVDSVEGERSSKNAAFVQAVAEANVHQTMEDISAQSEVIREMVEKGEVKIVGGMYDLSTGKVTWLK